MVFVARSQSIHASRENAFVYDGSASVAYQDQETNLHYNYFRDYDPGIGRYVQSDPIGLEGGLNTFGYTLANPLSFIDLHGLNVTVCHYPSGVQHVGFGISRADGTGSGTSGFYPRPGASRIAAGFGQWVPGQVRPDKPEDDTQCKVIPADKKQDDCMAKCQQRRSKNPGLYHITGRNCVSYVRACLSECGLPSGSSWDPFPRSWFDSLKGGK